jgi:membrane-bound inhibitor of C-type lysozyme
MKQYGQISSSYDLVSKGYVDSKFAELKDAKNSARVATTAVLDATYSGAGKTLTMNSNGALSIDSVSLALNNRVLVKNQTLGNRTENGIYYVTTVGDAGTAAVLTRATDFDESSEITAGCYLTIEEGTTNADSMWVLTTNDPITLDTSLLEFSKLSPTIYTAGDGIDITNFEVAADVSDFAGTGLEDDGSNNLRISSNAAGNGLTGGSGSALSVVAGDGISVSTDVAVKLESDGGIQFDSTNKGLEVKLNGASLAVGTDGLKKNTYSSSITWSGSGPYTFSITAATHGLGATRNLDIKVYENNDLVMTDVAVAANGDVTITSTVDFSNGTVQIQ